MKRIFTLLSLGLSVAATSQSLNRTAAAFTPGNIVVYRVGDSSAALTSAATAVFLDEYTPAGVRVQSIALPTTTNGANRAVTAGGSTTSEGMISRSENGQYILATGYDAALGTAAVAGTTSTTVNRVVALVDAAGNINSSTALTDAYSGGNIRSATSANGTDIYTGGSTGGIRYTTAGSTTSTTISTVIGNIRTVNIFAGQLYASAQSGSLRVGSLGTGTPTTTNQAFTFFPGIPTTVGSTTTNTSPYQFFLADLSTTEPGLDVLYIADDNSAANNGGIQKYSLVSGTWVSNGIANMTASSSTAIAGFRGLTGSVTTGVVTLYTSTSTSLYSLIDASGYNNTIVPNILSPIASAPTNTNFRGLALSPGNVALPLSITSFKASLATGQVQLTWTSLNEQNVQGFIVERSTDAQNFSTVGQLSANNSNNANYTFTDKAPLAGSNYYRLRITDKNGAVKYSSVVNISNRESLKTQVFPNPTFGNITVSHFKAINGAEIRILNAEGKQVKAYPVEAGAIQTSLTVGQLLKGNYILVFDNNGERTSTKFIKQ